MRTVLVGNAASSCAYGAWVTDEEIIDLWKAGLDTLDISRCVGLPEHTVANRLPGLLTKARESQEWNADFMMAK